jgi:hypothetical protein
VPVNWKRVKDIAQFFSSTSRIDGKRIYGHMDCGKRALTSAGA